MTSRSDITNIPSAKSWKAELAPRVAVIKIKKTMPPAKPLIRAGTSPSNPLRLERTTDSIPITKGKTNMPTAPPLRVDHHPDGKTSHMNTRYNPTVKTRARKSLFPTLYQD